MKERIIRETLSSFNKKEWTTFCEVANDCARCIAASGDNDTANKILEFSAENN